MFPNPSSKIFIIFFSKMFLSCSSKLFLSCSLKIFSNCSSKMFLDFSLKMFLSRSSKMFLMCFSKMFLNCYSKVFSDCSSNYSKYPQMFMILFNRKMLQLVTIYQCFDEIICLSWLAVDYCQYKKSSCLTISELKNWKLHCWPAKYK